MMTSVKISSWITFGFCLAAALGIFVETAAYPAAQGSSLVQGSAFYPRLLAGLMAALGTLLVGRDILAGRGQVSRPEAEPTPKSDETPDSDDSPEYKGGYTRVVLVFVLTVAMAFMIRYLGFLAAGALFLFIAAPLVGPQKGYWSCNRFKNLIKDLAFSLGTMAVIYIVFELFVGLELPKAMMG